MGVLFQQGALFTDLNVFENVAFPLREHAKLSPTELLARVLDTLEAVGLRAAAHLRVSEISGGMARRVALARAVVLEPELVLYDEPFAGLDPISLGITARLIRTRHEAGAEGAVVAQQFASGGRSGGHGDEPSRRGGAPTARTRARNAPRGP